MFHYKKYENVKCYRTIKENKLMELFLIPCTFVRRSRGKNINQMLNIMSNNLAKLIVTILHNHFKKKHINMLCFVVFDLSKIINRHR